MFASPLYETSSSSLTRCHLPYEGEALAYRKASPLRQRLPFVGELSSKARLRGFVFFYQNYNNEKVLRQQTFSRDFCAENALSPNKKGPPRGEGAHGCSLAFQQNASIRALFL